MKRLLVAALIVFPLYANATWKPEYASQPQEVRDWYQNAELTQEAQKVFFFKKCCAQAETVKTKFKVNHVNGSDEWFWLDPSDGQWKQVPDYIIHYGESGPHGEAVLFSIGPDKLTCFFPPESGN